MYILLAIVGLVASASAKDVIVGDEGGRIIFEQNVTASPTIWRQERNLTINASDSEVITRVVIIDNREDKNGEAAVVEGGEGYKNVTIELKSPAVFRGYDFEIQVYAKLEDGAQKPIDNDQQNAQGTLNLDTDVNDKQAPKDEPTDVIKGLVTPVPTSSTTQVVDAQDKVQHPSVVAKNEDEQVRQNHDTQEQQEEQKPLNPAPVEKDSQSTEDDESDEDQAQENKGFNPKPNDDDWHAVIDQIFAENNPIEPTKPGHDSADTQKVLIDGDEDLKENDTDRPLIIDFPSSTTKIVEEQDQKSVQIQEANDSQHVKEQQIKGVPLPYVKN